MRVERVESVCHSDPIEKTKELRVRGIERRREGEREKNTKI